MAVLDELVVVVSANTKQLKEAMTTGARAVASSAKNIRERLGDVGNAARNNFDKFTKSITGGILAADLIRGAFNQLSAAVKQGAQDFLEFDAAVAEVNSILPQNAKLTDEARQRFIQFSSTFGGTPAQQAKAFYQIVSAGISDVTQATKLLDTANKAAIAGVTDVETAVNGLTTVLNVFGDQGVDSARAADVLFQTVQAGKTTFPELSNSIGRVASLAKTAGLSFEELAGTLGFVTTRGVSTEEAVTGLRGLLTQLAAPSEGAAKAAADLGIEIGAAAVKSQGFSTVLRNVTEAAGGNLQILRTLIPDVQATSTAATIASGGFDQFEAALAAAANSGGAAANAFREVEQSASFQFEALTQELRNLPVLFFEAAKGPLADLIVQLRQNLPAATQIAVTVTAALLDVIGVLSRAFGGLTATVVASTETIAAGFQVLQALVSGTTAESIAAVENFKEVVSSVGEEVAEEFSSSTFNDVADSIRQIGPISTESFGQTSAAIDRTTASLQMNQEVVAELSALEQKRIESNRKFTDGIIESAAVEQAASEQRLEALQLEFETKNITEEEYFARKRELMEADFEREKQILEERLSQEQFNAQERDKIDAQLAASQTARRKKLFAEEQAAEEARNREKIRGQRQTLGTIATLQFSGNKELAAIGKAAAISQATIDGIAAVQKALASVPFPLNFAAAALVGTATAANVARIASAPTFARGIDEVPGTGFRDNFPAVLAPGERVVPKDTNKDLKEFLSGKRMMGPQVVNKYNITVNDVLSSDPREVGRQIIEVINEAAQANGVTTLGAEL